MSSSETETQQTKLYGQEDATYQALGAYDGIKKLVDDFYDIMASLKQAEKIFNMHPANNEVSRDKLTCFLSGWTGGPRLFKEKYGAISIPMAHQHLEIGTAEKDAWMTCMAQALDKQAYNEELKAYMLTQLNFPAERCRNRD